ncbi:MAG: DUF2207 domain-containing protein [Candidatus Saccharimonadales bacterium]
MIRFPRVLAAVLLVASSALLWAAPVYADVNDFTITHFSADETLSRADKQGSLHIQETIDVVFTDSNHGLLRALPETYKDHTLHVSNIKISSATGAPTDLSTSTSNGNMVLRIGNPNQTVTGVQQYTITYDVDNVITFYNDHDELYWDVNGDQWGQPVSVVDYMLHLPVGLALSTQQPACFAGAYGSTTAACIIQVKDNSITASANNLAPGQTLTVVAGFNPGFFTAETTAEKVQPYIKPAIMVAALPLLTLAVGWSIWWRRGRDPTGRGTIVPEYTPPEGLRATEMGALMDFKVDNRDITAAIIDLALRKYLRIIETSKDRLLGPDKQDYQLELLKDDFTELRNYEKELLGALFEVTTVGAKTDISSAKNKFYTTAKVIRDQVEDSLQARGYFRSSPKKYLKASSALVIVGVFAFYMLGALHLFAVSLLLSMLIAWLFARVMPSRSTLGVTAKEQSEGLRLYLNTAEKDRIAMLQSPNAPYASQSSAPEKTVELFEKLLPYAMVLGVEKQWAKQFEGIYRQPPDWYNGNWSTFNSLGLVNSLSGGFQNNFNTAFTAPSSSGSSGFGGGGFSGGGGGGGGGGGW